MRSSRQRSIEVKPETGIIGLRVQNPAWGEVGEAEFGKESGCGGGENWEELDKQH